MQPVFTFADFVMLALFLSIVLVAAFWFGILPGIGFLWLVGVL